MHTALIHAHKLLLMVRCSIHDSAATPCRSMPCCAMRRVINSVGTLYVRGLCRLHQRFGPYRLHTSETSFCSNSAPRYVCVHVMKKTLKSTFATNAADSQTYVCLHSEFNNTTLNRRALRRAGVSQPTEELLRGRNYTRSMPASDMLAVAIVVADGNTIGTRIALTLLSNEPAAGHCQEENYGRLA